MRIDWHSVITAAALAFLCVVIIATLNGCQDEQTAADVARERNIAAQNDVISRATAAVPVPHVDNFLARQNLAEYLRRMDDPNKVWYIYELAFTGSPIGYYVSSSYPQSICTFMTPPQQVLQPSSNSYGNTAVVVTAPALDGIYYGAAGCDLVFFFDLNSGAMVFTSINRVRASDQPLDIEVPQITMRAAE